MSSAINKFERAEIIASPHISRNFARLALANVRMLKAILSASSIVIKSPQVFARMACWAEWRRVSKAGDVGNIVSAVERKLM
jgi:hypothetical protein